MYNEANEPITDAATPSPEELADTLTQTVIERLNEEILDTDYVGGVESLVEQLRHPENTIEDLELILEPVLDYTYVQALHDHGFIEAGNPENDPQLDELAKLDPTKLLDEQEKADASRLPEVDSSKETELLSPEDQQMEARRARWRIILSQSDVGGISGLYKSVSGENPPPGVIINTLCRVYALGHFDSSLLAQGNPNHDPNLDLIFS